MDRKHRGETPASGFPERRRRISVLSLGCRTNQEEMECLISRLGEAGCLIVPFGEEADWVVVNTCTVTSAGDSDSRQMVRRALRGKGAGRVVVTGCLAQRDPEAFRDMLGVDWVVGNGEKPDLLRWILEAEIAREGGPDAARDVPGAVQVRVGQDPTLPAFSSFGSGREGRRTRATLKIQDGCSAHCAYCIVPSVRGRPRSRPLDGVLEQAARLAGTGYREIVLTGINTAAWGLDLDATLRLPDLIEALEGVAGLERIRLNSLEPQFFSPSWLDRLAACSKLCRHLHLPLQSGDAAVLRRMLRRTTPEEYAALVLGLIRRMPDSAVGADVMVGFPGETEEEFQTTEEFLSQLPLAYLHVFSFSPRPGTKAEAMSGRPAVSVCRERSCRLRSLDQRLRRAFARSQLSSVHSVLPESPSGEGCWQGLTGNYLRVRFPWSEARPDSPLPLVLLEGAPEGGMLAGRVLSP